MSRGLFAKFARFGKTLLRPACIMRHNALDGQTTNGRIRSQLVSRIITSVLACILGVCATMQATKPKTKHTAGDKQMRLGNFSVSLAVKDLAASRAFYEKLGFRVVGGNGKNYSIMQNETSTIGLYQGMFEKNSLTYNPGWDRN